MLTPALALALTIQLTTPRGGRRAVWSQVGWRRPDLRSVATAFLLPAGVTASSFGAAWLIGVAHFPGLHIDPGAGLPLGLALIVGTLSACAKRSPGVASSTRS